MSITVVTQPQTTTYNVAVTRQETTYNVAVSLERGPIGPAPTLTFPAPTSVAAGGAPSVQVTETSPGEYSVQFGLVAGMTGPAIVGPKGEAATVAVGTVTTGDPGTEATVMNSGTTSAAVLDFTLPQGEPGAGVPDTAGATSGEVVRYNGTTTEWGALGTAADVDTGTGEGNVPVLDADGKLPTSTYDTASLSHLSGTLATDVSLVTSATTTILTITGLTAGTWLVTVNITIAGGDSTARAVAIQAAAGTGSPALAGQTSTETYMNNSTTGGTVREAVLTLTFLVTCTGSSTVIVQSPPTLATAKASTSLNNLAHASGWTAVKIA